MQFAAGGSEDEAAAAVGACVASGAGSGEDSEEGVTVKSPWRGAGLRFPAIALARDQHERLQREDSCRSEWRSRFRPLGVHGACSGRVRRRASR